MCNKHHHKDKNHHGQKKIHNNGHGLGQWKGQWKGQGRACNCQNGGQCKCKLNGMNCHCGGNAVNQVNAQVNQRMINARVGRYQNPQNYQQLQMWKGQGKACNCQNGGQCKCNINGMNCHCGGNAVNQIQKQCKNCY